MKYAFSIFISRYWNALLASVAACVFIYLFTRHSGVGISPDSVNYESAATNIRQHFSFTDFNGMPLVNFPLGYPCFLAFVSWLSQCSVLCVAPLLNALLFSGVILLTGVLLNSFRNTSTLFKTCILALLACSPCLLEVYSMLWSETLFLFLSVLCMVLLKWYFKSYSIPSLICVAVCVAFAFVTRYAGFSILGAVCFLVLFNGELAISKKIKHLIILIVTGCSLVVINLLRNHSAAGHTTGVREKALKTIADNIAQIGVVMVDWLPFLKGYGTIASVIFLIVLVGSICLLIYHCLQQQYFTSTQTIAAAFFTTYSLFIITIASISRFEDLSNRLLSPLYIPMILISGYWMVSFVNKLTRIKRMIAVVFIFIIYAGFHINHYKLNADAWEGIKDAGVPGYTEDSWKQSPAVALVKANKNNLTQPIYSNANDAAYFMNGIHAFALPHKEIQQEIDELLARPSFYLIWYINGDNPDLVSLDFIKQHKKLISAKETEEGGIYLFADSTAH